MIKQKSLRKIFERDNAPYFPPPGPNHVQLNFSTKMQDVKRVLQRWSRGHKARGQGQPFRGQTLSRPKTGMLEAKAKDQGHKRKCSPKKKKVFTKIFQAISKKKKGLHKNFSSDLHKKTFSKKFFKRFTKF